MCAAAIRISSTRRVHPHDHDTGDEPILCFKLLSGRRSLRPEFRVQRAGRR
jgi:hypothetical protein